MASLHSNGSQGNSRGINNRRHKRANRYKPNSAVRVESLEDRRLFAVDPNAVYALPFVVNFDTDRGDTTFLDKDGQGTGLDYIQQNKNNNAYRAALLDLDTASGVLNLTTSGSATSGTNYDGDNTLTNAVGVQFDGTQGKFEVNTRLVGPLTNIDRTAEQAGVMFGLGQNDYVKFGPIAADKAGGGFRNLLRLADEQYLNGYKHTKSEIIDIGSFATINTLDLKLTGDPATGTVRAAYSVNGAAFVEVATTITIDPSRRAKFFSTTSRGSIYAFHKNNVGPMTVKFDSFSVVAVAPATGTAKAEFSTSLLPFNDPRGGSASPAERLTIRNSGTAALSLPADAFTISGPDAALFTIVSKPGAPGSISAGASADVTVNFNPLTATTIAIKTATLTIKTSDPLNPLKTVELRGIPTTGTGGANELSLQRVLDLWKIPTNVGDDDPNTAAYPKPNVGPNDEVATTSLLKADATKPVSVDVLAVMGVSSTPAVRFGYHAAGSPLARTQLFTVPTADAQSVAPAVNGLTSFDPGATEFGLYTQWPGFTDAGAARVTDSEDQFNTWEPNAQLRHKTRFFSLRDAGGNVVPNAYVVAFEEYQPDSDSNDLVLIIRNVKPPTANTPEIGIDNLDGVPFTDRLSFNIINIKDPKLANEFHNTAQVRVSNTGTAALDLSSVKFTGPFALAAAAPTSIAAGQSVVLTVRFTATSSGYYSGTMTVSSNDVDEPTKSLKLAGHWQYQSESGREPNLAGIVGNIFGYKTQVAYAGQSLNTGGKATAVGDEVLSRFWSRADTASPVTVRQLAAYHTQGGQTLLQYYPTSTKVNVNLFRHAATDGQAILPNLTGSTTAPAFAAFNPSGSFGWRIDSEDSDDTRNPQEKPGGGYGHHVRFYPAKDNAGVLIPSTYLMVMDYAGINYDFQDNIYLVTNVRPAETPGAPANVLAISFNAGVELRWSPNTEIDLAGYNVYRAASLAGTYTKLTATPATLTKWFDRSPATAGATYSYKVTALDTTGLESPASFVTAIRQSAGGAIA